MKEVIEWEMGEQRRIMMLDDIVAHETYEKIKRKAI